MLTFSFSTSRRILCVLYLGIIAPLAALGCDSGYSNTSSNPNAANQPNSLKRGLPALGSVSPPFQLIDLQGNQIALSDYKGKVSAKG